MSSPCPEAFTATLLALTAGLSASAQTRTLRFCAEPDHLPFSNQRLEGIENRVAQIIADELHAKADFTWWAQRQGYVRQTLLADRCDILTAIPEGADSVLTTVPYYRTSYVLLVRRNGRPSPASLDDPALDKLRIGIQARGANYSPPGHILAARGLHSNLVPFRSYSETDDTGQRLVHAVADGDVDAAAVWGPVAGYLISREQLPIEIVPLRSSRLLPAMPLSFGICLGVQPDKVDLKNELDLALARRKDEISKLVRSFGIPEVSP